MARKAVEGFGEPKDRKEDFMRQGGDLRMPDVLWDVDVDVSLVCSI